MYAGDGVAQTSNGLATGGLNSKNVYKSQAKVDGCNNKLVPTGFPVSQPAKSFR